MVEWKPLYKLVKSISTGLNPRQNFILNEEDASLYYVTVKEITTNKVIFSDSTDRITENAKQIINNRSKLSKGDILFSGIGTIGKVAYVDIPTSNWDCSESVFLIKPNELETKGKYLAYILSSDIAKNQYERGAAGAIMKGVRKATLESLLIPIPSLPEQQRIVEQLDTFTNSIENLKEQIAQRRKQYEYYRDQLLDLEGKEGVVMKTLGEVSNYRRGSFPQPYGNKEWYDGDGAMPFVQVADVEEFSRKLKDTTKQYISKLAMAKSVYAPKGTVIVTLQGSIGKVAITQYDSYVDRTLGIFEGYRINIDKVYFALQLEKIFSIKREKARGGTIKTITKEEFTNFPIPIPSLQEQQRIVSILDTFEASITNLEAQLKQREKQYEYYRNKLLTFE